jgi:hypothetical protein
MLPEDRIREKMKNLQSLLKSTQKRGGEIKEKDQQRLALLFSGDLKDVSRWCLERNDPQLRETFDLFNKALQRLFLKDHIQESKLFESIQTQLQNFASEEFFKSRLGHRKSSSNLDYDQFLKTIPKRVSKWIKSYRSPMGLRIDTQSFEVEPAEVSSFEDLFFQMLETYFKHQREENKETPRIWCRFSRKGCWVSLRADCQFFSFNNSEHRSAFMADYKSLVSEAQKWRAKCSMAEGDHAVSLELKWPLLHQSMDVQVAQVGQMRFAIPIKSFRWQVLQAGSGVQKQQAFLHLCDFFEIPSRREQGGRICAESNGRQIYLEVDELHGRSKISLEPLDHWWAHQNKLQGAGLDENLKPLVILDTSVLSAFYFRSFDQDVESAA